MDAASGSKAADDVGDRLARGMIAGEPRFQCTLSVGAEVRPQEPLGRSPGSEGANRCRFAGRFTFPG